LPETSKYWCAAAPNCEYRQFDGLCQHEFMWGPPSLTATATSSAIVAISNPHTIYLYMYNVYTYYTYLHINLRGKICFSFFILPWKL
jgi:hypothetical protein